MLKQITLHNFCGFRDFTVDTDEFTLLIGPNNGGKTTILRAVKFCLDACRSAFLPNGQLNVMQLKQARRQAPLQTIAGALGIVDLESLYFKRNRSGPASVSLQFSSPRKFCLRAECSENNDIVDTSIEWDGTPPQELSEEAAQELVACLRPLAVEFVQPPESLPAVEQVMQWSQVESLLASGRYTEIWRNRIQWMSEGKPPELLQRIVNRVRSYLGEIDLRPPRRSRTQQQVEIIYLEDGVEHDIAVAGNGVRTLLTLAAAVELSEAPILLFDEPDSHLHSTIQRQVASFLQESATPDKQIIVTTHAPDFIEESPVDSIVWIDRQNMEGQKCDEVGKALIDLGAVSHSTALASIGANAIVFVEGKPDRIALRAVLKKCDKSNLLDRARLENLKGYGNTDKLSGVLKVIRSLRDAKLSIAVILDADYTQTTPTGSSKTIDGVLEIRLPCKELENLLLLSPESISDAVGQEAERRRLHSADIPSPPGQQEIEDQINVFTGADDLEDTVRRQWVCCRANEQNQNLNEPAQLSQIEAEFRQRWNDGQWRTRCCPGKEVLKRLRRWLQDEYSLTLSITSLFDCYEPSDEIRPLMEALAKHIG